MGAWCQCDGRLASAVLISVVISMAIGALLLPDLITLDDLSLAWGSRAVPACAPDPSGPPGERWLQAVLPRLEAALNTQPAFTHPARARPSWWTARSLAEAAFLFGRGHWVRGHDSQPALTPEEKALLRWGEEDARNRPQADLENVSRLFHDYANASLYGTEHLSWLGPQGKYWCRLAVNNHWCMPGLHGAAYHSTRWSRSSGAHVLSVFERVRETDPAVALVGDSVMMEFYTFALCSLARHGVRLGPCAAEWTKPFAAEWTKPFRCASFPFRNGTARLLFYDDQSYHPDLWRTVLNELRLHVVLPNLGMHYNYPMDVLRYKADLASLLQMMRAASQTHPRKLLALLGSFPQHFRNRNDEIQNGLFNRTGGGKSHGLHCSPLPFDLPSIRLNRWRDEAVWEVLTNGSFPTGALPGSPEYLLAERVSTEDTLSGVLHLEVWAWFQGRAEVHPSRRCLYYFPITYLLGTTEPCTLDTDCTHHCYSPLMAEVVWERLEMAVAFHYQGLSDPPNSTTADRM